MNKRNNISKSIADLLEQNNQGIRLDIGCGNAKQKGFVGIDIRPLPGVDIVQDLEEFPWPLPDESVSFAMSSHVIEHINPAKGIFLQFMNEVWRIMKPDCQFASVMPYAGSPGYWQDPTHINGCTPATFAYFDPLTTGSSLYYIYEPAPWKVVTCTYDVVGNLEIVLEKRRDDISYHADKKIHYK